MKKKLDPYALALAAVASERPPYIPHGLWPKQQAFFDDDGREVLYGGSAGGGKSEALLASALKYFHVKGYSAILFRRTYADLALPEAIMDRSHDWLAGKADWNDRDKTWTSKEGATLTFGYMDGPRDHFRYQGAAFHFVGFDELTQFLEKQYRYLFSRQRRLAGFELPIRMRAATNPGDIGHDWVKARFGIPNEIDFGTTYSHEGRKFFPAKLADNPSLDADEYRKALAELDPVTREQLEHGRWIRDASGLVYQVDKERNLIDELPQLPNGEKWSYVIAFDYGVVDDTAFAILAFSEHHDVVYVVEAGSWKGLIPSAAAVEAQKLEATYNFDRMIGDVGGLGKGFAEEARQRFAIPIEPAQKANKLGYIRLMNGDLSNKKLMFVRGTAEEALAEMSALAWADDKQLKEHPSLPNHKSDAVLYAWREARHWAWEPRDDKPETDLKRLARANFGYGEAEEVEKYQREERVQRRTRSLLGLWN